MSVGPLKLSLNFGFFKLDYELKKTEQASIMQLFRDFSSYDILTGRVNFVSHSVNDVEEIKIKIHDFIQTLSMNSGVANNFIALETLCSEFLSTAKHTSSEVTRIVNLLKRSIDKGEDIGDKSMQLLDNYSLIGGEPDLIKNSQVKFSDILPERLKISFVMELGRFTGAFGAFLYLIAIKNNIIIPPGLGPLLPSRNAYDMTSEDKY